MSRLDDASRRRVRRGRPRLPSTRGERDALREHLLSCAFGGLSFGLVGLTDVVLAKTLNVPGWQITLLATLAPAANLTSFWWAGQTAGREKGGYFLLGGALFLAPMAALLVLRRPGWLIAGNFLFWVATALAITATNAVLQQRYRAVDRARWFGWSAAVTALSGLVAVPGAGWLLSRNESAYPWIFSLAGAAGFFSCYHLFRMDAGADRPRGLSAWLGAGGRSLRRRLRRDPQSAYPGGRESLQLFRRILREHPDFVRFERGFMVYGFAFMGVLPVLPLYVVRELHLSYGQLAATKGIWSQIGLIVLSPFLGTLLGRARPLLFTGRTFLALALYPLLLLVSSFPVWADRVSWVYAALFCYGFAMTGVNLSWNLGSMHFAGSRDASAFQGVHVALTGVRGLLAPGLGYLAYRQWGAAPVFAAATILLLVAGWLLLRQDREEGVGRAAVGVEAEAVGGRPPLG